MRLHKCLFYYIPVSLLVFSPLICEYTLSLEGNLGVLELNTQKSRQHTWEWLEYKTSNGNKEVTTGDREDQSLI